MLFLNLGFDGLYRIEEEPGYSIGNYGNSLESLMSGVSTVDGKDVADFKELEELPKEMKLTWTTLEPVIPKAIAEIIITDEEALKWAEENFTLEDTIKETQFVIYNEDVLKLWEPEVKELIMSDKIVLIDIDLPIKQISPLRERIEGGLHVEQFELIELVERALFKREIHELLASIGEHYGLSDEYDGQPQLIGVNEAHKSDLGFVEAEIEMVAGTFVEKTLHIPTFLLYETVDEAKILMDSSICRHIKDVNERRYQRELEIERALKAAFDVTAAHDWSELIDDFKKAKAAAQE